MGDLPITIFWKNIRGETIYTERKRLDDVIAIINTDERAVFNTYMLPNNQEMFEIELREWYATQTGTDVFAA